jgi:hypothetical protein
MAPLQTMDQAEYVSRMQAECRRILGQVADAVNNAPTGNVIGGSEMQVRDLMEELRRRAYETAVQMRIDSHESSFSPSEGSGGQGSGEQGPVQPQPAHGQRSDPLVQKTLPGRGKGKHKSVGQAGG